MNDYKTQIEKLNPKQITLLVNKLKSLGYSKESTTISDNKLVSFISVKEDIDEEHLKQYLKNKLPDYMIPDDLIFIPYL